MLTYYFASAIKIHFGSVSSAIILRFVLSAIAWVCMVTHATSLEERLGVLMIASSLSTDSEFLERFRDPSVEWVPLPVLPSMHVAKVLLSANRAKIRGVLQRWLQEDTVRWRSHKILLSRPRFAAFWNRVEPVLRTVAATEPGFPIKMPVRDLELHSEL